MPNTVKAFDEMIARIMIIISSSKFWITVGSMVFSVITALNLSDPIWKVVLIVLGVIGCGAGYVGAKTYQNTHGENSPEVIIEAMKTEVK
jgi:uncharacterized membrane protein